MTIPNMEIFLVQIKYDRFIMDDFSLNPQYVAAGELYKWLNNYES